MKTNLKDPSNWIPKEIFLAYCGENSKKISDFYDKATSKKNRMSFSVNWLAVLMFPAWLGYRKQWALLGVFTGLMAILPILEALFQFSIPNGVFSGPMVVFGTMANGLLLASANQSYLKLKKAGLDETAIAEKMKNQARGSVGLAIASLVACLVTITAFGYIAEKFISRTWG